VSAVSVGLGILAAAFLLSLLRVVRGPTLADRAAATDVCMISILGGIGLLSVRFDQTYFLDAVVIASLIHFVSTMALARLIEGGEEQ
jgi:multicomponent Na+:H+ antiporter subunit F